MKCEKSSENQTSKKLLIKSIHNLFSDPKWRPNDKMLDDELQKHDFFNFREVLNEQSNYINL
jgi:hypothetical protein